MGVEQAVTFPGATPPTWAALRDLLAKHGYPIQPRMINGELSFPDEEPPDDWRELRVGTPQGMVTLRRAADRVQVVTWGNADAGLLQAWNGLAWALAEAGGGSVQSSAGSQTAAEFRRTADLPPALGSA